MLITVHLAPNAAQQIRDRGRAAAGDLQATLDDLGLTLEPLHPGATDPELAGQFYADVADADAAGTCARLLENAAVVAAYTKPAGAPPSSGPL